MGTPGPFSACTDAASGGLNLKNRCWQLIDYDSDSQDDARSEPSN